MIDNIATNSLCYKHRGKYKILENIRYRSRRLVDLKCYETSVFNNQDDPKASLSNKYKAIAYILLDKIFPKEQSEHGEYTINIEGINSQHARSLTISARYNLAPPNRMV